ncbi:MAG TPA: hypothetical protein DEP63_03690 [Candidatus Magasanikbacteria bacterium]|nr:hypothetical protein [Candidatus Magasanikbacteria bacterium]
MGITVSDTAGSREEHAASSSTNVSGQNFFISEAPAGTADEANAERGVPRLVERGAHLHVDAEGESLEHPKASADVAAETRLHVREGVVVPEVPVKGHHDRQRAEVADQETRSTIDFVAGVADGAERHAGGSAEAVPSPAGAPGPAELDTAEASGQATRGQLTAAEEEDVACVGVGRRLHDGGGLQHEGRRGREVLGALLVGEALAVDGVGDLDHLRGVSRAADDHGDGDDDEAESNNNQKRSEVTHGTLLVERSQTRPGKWKRKNERYESLRQMYISYTALSVDSYLFFLTPLFSSSRQRLKRTYSPPCLEPFTRKDIKQGRALRTSECRSARLVWAVGAEALRAQRRPTLSAVRDHAVGPADVDAGPTGPDVARGGRRRAVRLTLRGLVGAQALGPGQGRTLRAVEPLGDGRRAVGGGVGGADGPLRPVVGRVGELLGGAEPGVGGVLPPIGVDAPLLHGGAPSLGLVGLLLEAHDALADRLDVGLGGVEPRPVVAPLAEGEEGDDAESGQGDPKGGGLHVGLLLLARLVGLRGGGGGGATGLAHVDSSRGTSHLCRQAAETNGRGGL